MTYCNIETEDIKRFRYNYDIEELKSWFDGVIREYSKWSDFQNSERIRRNSSIKQIKEFPFKYRPGQRGLAVSVYRAVEWKKRLFIQAPTGVGKTISTVFPAMKAMSRGMGDKLFYLTAKTITRTVADDTIALLREGGLHFKSVILTAKEKICFMEKSECNPENCPYARGHYDRINDAIYDMLIHEESFTRERIEDYAKKHEVCPFEMCLDMSLFADGIICDYNYLFDPHVYLKRFFGDGVRGDYLFLIDEAHNLLERGREMYSASLWKEQFAALKRELKQELLSEKKQRVDKNSILGQMTLGITEWSGVRIKHGYGEQMLHQLEACNKELLALEGRCEEYCLVESVDDFVRKLMRFYSTLGEYLEEPEEKTLPIREQLLDFYFAAGHFLDIYELLDEHYVKYAQSGEDGSFLLKLFCVNPCENLRECMRRGRSTILFSATFLPIQYYKRLLGGEAEDYEVYAKSVFNPEKKGLFIAEDVTSKYTRRSAEEYFNIARYIEQVVKNRHGNYMVFCPSYSFMQTVYDMYVEHFADEQKECIIQKESMTEEEREDFLAHFRGNEDCDLQAHIKMEIELEEEHSLIGFCVLGGIFGEGIDLKKDSLIGAIIVGTGIPQVCCEREILKHYFDEEGENGFDYSYRYPAMNKVLQAAGRVIRTVEDVGIVVLLDERFLQFSYRKMFPREWEQYEVVRADTAAKRVERFWDSWL